MTVPLPYWPFYRCSVAGQDRNTNLLEQPNATRCRKIELNFLTIKQKNSFDSKREIGIQGDNEGAELDVCFLGFVFSLGDGLSTLTDRESKGIRGLQFALVMLTLMEIPATLIYL